VFDTAVVYGQYTDTTGGVRSRAIELLAEAFSDRRNDVHICLKVGQYDERSHRSNFEPPRIVEQVIRSLRELRTDYIDICLIHAPSLATVRNGAAIAVLQTLQAIGMVRAVGYAFENEPTHAREALRQQIDVLMLQYNLLDAECRFIPSEATDKGVGILIGGPFKRGYLTGVYKSIADLPLEDDYWLWNVRRAPGKVAAILERVSALARDGNVTSPEELRRNALHFVLSTPGVSSAIVGHRSIREVEENVSLARLLD
jgi:aryl-alcohol dehydrogenase-like predicted oxidoreductase